MTFATWLAWLRIVWNVEHHYPFLQPANETHVFTRERR
jgi:hypothetical protein